MPDVSKPRRAAARGQTSSSRPPIGGKGADVDHQVRGRIAADSELRISNRVVFTSDNGGETNVTANAPFRAGKPSLYEGGIRVPLVVRWPRVVPPGTVSDEPTSCIDFYPTLLDCAGITPDPRQQLDGVSLVPVLNSPDADLGRETLYWHYISALLKRDCTPLPGKCTR